MFTAEAYQKSRVIANSGFYAGFTSLSWICRQRILDGTGTPSLDIIKSENRAEHASYEILDPSRHLFSCLSFCPDLTLPNIKQYANPVLSWIIFKLEYCVQYFSILCVHYNGTSKRGETEFKSEENQRQVQGSEK